jgi:hypothetical protein
MGSRSLSVRLGELKAIIQQQPWFFRAYVELDELYAAGSLTRAREALMLRAYLRGTSERLIEAGEEDIRRYEDLPVRPQDQRVVCRTLSEIWAARGELTRAVELYTEVVDVLGIVLQKLRAGYRLAYEELKVDAAWFCLDVGEPETAFRVMNHSRGEQDGEAAEQGIVDHIVRAHTLRCTTTPNHRRPTAHRSAQSVNIGFYSKRDPHELGLPREGRACKVFWLFDGPDKEAAAAMCAAADGFDIADHIGLAAFIESRQIDLMVFCDRPGRARVDDLHQHIQVPILFGFGSTAVPPPMHTTTRPRTTPGTFHLAIPETDPAMHHPMFRAALSKALDASPDLVICIPAEVRKLYSSFPKDQVRFDFEFVSCCLDTWPAPSWRCSAWARNWGVGLMSSTSAAILGVNLRSLNPPPPLPPVQLRDFECELALWCGVTLTGEEHATICTLGQWIRSVRSFDPRVLLTRIIVNASRQDGSDGSVPFSIGVSWSFTRDLSSLSASEWTAMMAEPDRRDVRVVCCFDDKSDGRRRGPVRHQIARTLETGPLRLSNTKLPPAEYMRALGRSRFIISPEGNGVDCHRHYEAILMGAVPIIEDSPEMRAKYGRCPVLFTTRRYEELTAEYLDAEYARLVTQTFDFGSMFVDAYKPEVVRSIRDNGRFWMRMMDPAWFARHGAVLGSAEPPPAHDVPETPPQGQVPAAIVETLRTIPELAAVMVEGAEVVASIRPRANSVANDRWQPTMVAVSLLAMDGKLPDGVYFLCVHDGWRELSPVVAPADRRFVQLLDMPAEERSRVNAFQGAEVRFVNPDPSTYPVLCRPVLAFSRHYEDPSVILIPPLMLAQDGFARVLKTVSLRCRSVRTPARLVTVGDACPDAEEWFALLAADDVVPVRPDPCPWEVWFSDRLVHRKHFIVQGDSMDQAGLQAVARSGAELAEAIRQWRQKLQEQAAAGMPCDVCQGSDATRRILSMVGQSPSSPVRPVVAVINVDFLGQVGKLVVPAFKTDRLRVVCIDDKIAHQMRMVGMPDVKLLPENVRDQTRLLSDMSSQPWKGYVISGENLMHSLIWACGEFKAMQSAEGFMMTPVHGGAPIFMAQHRSALKVAQEASRLKRPFVMVTHNENVPIDPRQEQQILSMPNLVAWFAPQISGRHPKLHHVPLGIANSGHEYGNVDTILTVRENCPVRDRNCLLLSPSDSMQESVRCKALTATKSPTAFRDRLALIARHAYCICPSSACGPDSHLFWEALYVGTVPVVRRSAWAEAWREWVPMAIVDEWSEAARLSSVKPADRGLPPALSVGEWVERVLHVSRSAT